MRKETFILSARKTDTIYTLSTFWDCVALKLHWQTSIDIQGADDKLGQILSQDI
jgi:hypothetical protein